MSLERRHHRERLRKARSSYWGGIEDSQRAGQVIDTPTPCSCWMCGNPRRYEGRATLQERSARQRRLQDFCV